jgi:hypothetical protein
MQKDALNPHTTFPYPCGVYNVKGVLVAHIHSQASLHIRINLYFIIIITGPPLLYPCPPA